MKKKNFFLAHKQFTFFLILALLIILGAIFAPVVTGGADPLKGSLTEALEAPSWAHIFGTDKMGRDIFTRVIYRSKGFSQCDLWCGRSDFPGWHCGRRDGRIFWGLGRWGDHAHCGYDAGLSRPGAGSGCCRNYGGRQPECDHRHCPGQLDQVRKTFQKPGFEDPGPGLCVSGHCDRLQNKAYAFFLYASQRPAHADHYGHYRYWRHDAGTGGTVVSGFGTRPPAPEWGYMLNEGRACMQSAPWMMIFPGLAIFLVVTVFNMLGDSVRDILDPKEA